MDEPITTDEKDKIERFIKFISELRNHREARIARKEVAAWSATLLYFTILMTLSKFFSQESGVQPSIWITIFLPCLIVSLLVLIVLFIHSQFGVIAAAAAVDRVYRQYIFKLIKNPHEINNIDLTLRAETGFPEQMYQEIENQIRNIRKYNAFRKICIPFALLRFLWQKEEKRKKIHDIDRQEGIIYWLLLLATGVYWVHFYFLQG